MYESVSVSVSRITYALSSASLGVPLSFCVFVCWPCHANVNRTSICQRMDNIAHTLVYADIH